MDPVTLSLIAGGIQTGVGAIQRGAAAKRRRKAMANMRYDIPSAVTEQVQNARKLASQNGLPGEDTTRARMESDLARQTAKGESISSSASDVLGMYAKMYGQKSDIEQQILEKGAEYKSMNELELNKALGLMAEAENQQFYYNRFVPFLSQMQLATEQSQGGAANVAGGLQTAYQGWMNNWMIGQYKDIYGQQGTQPNIKQQLQQNRFNQMDSNAPILPDENMYNLNLG